MEIELYSPVAIRNPTSTNHTVIVHPSQRILVTLSDASIVHNRQAVVNSDFLELEHELYSNIGKTFVFKQKYDFLAWSKVARAFLGQIEFPIDGVIAPILSVTMDSLNHCKRDVVTAVNPADCTIKIYPHQILEVVAYMPVWGKDLTWNYAPIVENYMEMLYESEIDPTVYKMSESPRRLNDAFFTYPRMLQSSGISYNEQHWWFRFRPPQTEGMGIFGDKQPLASMSFVGSVAGQVRMVQTFKVEINDRPILKLGQPRSAEVTESDSCMDKGTEEWASNAPFVLPTFCPDSRRGKYRQKRYSPYLQSQVSSANPKLYSKRDIEVVPKPKSSLDYGCKVLELELSYNIQLNPQAALPAPVRPVMPLSTKAVYYQDNDEDQWE